MGQAAADALECGVAAVVRWAAVEVATARDRAAAEVEATETRLGEFTIRLEISSIVLGSLDRKCPFFQAERCRKLQTHRRQSAAHIQHCGLNRETISNLKVLLCTQVGWGPTSSDGRRRQST
jgi:hypothetical protein